MSLQFGLREQRAQRVRLDAEDVELEGDLELWVRDLRLLEAHGPRADEALVLGVKFSPTTVSLVIMRFPALLQRLPERSILGISSTAMG